MDNMSGGTSVQRVRVMLVDDDPMVRMGLRHMLGAASDLEVVAEVSDGDKVVAAVQAHRPDVIVLDVRMARMGGIETIAAVKARPEAPKVLMFTVFDHDDVAQRAIRAGADGFLLKTASPEEICGGIRNVAEGLGAVSPKTAAQLFTQVRDDPAATRRDAARRLMATLTTRERNVVSGLTRGLTNADLARELYVSETTVKTHLQSAFTKLGVDNRVQAGVIADRCRL
ncbi:LuxR family two component transcriptional regulator [Humibacillus xanthopallidus]|uniref:LuxR family two component transcriptional regulator n=1 Tax=Humibacillus xanthopallidus TaxID=412689 RepID=A0A543PNN6_9MICO|nr:response regulator transcription factor [Humibacillus xanthopallidus]TQN45683.1 LuxR family two component transcriptional regulator [Humibacillus xanthopallidus]